MRRYTGKRVERISMKKILCIVALVLVGLVVVVFVLGKLAAPDYQRVRAGIVDIDPHLVADGIYEGSASLIPVTVPTVDRGFRWVVFCSIDMAGESPSM